MRCRMPAIVLIFCSFALTPAAGAGSPGDAVNGKKLFLRDGCYACHGTQGAGGGIAGPQLVPNLPPFEAVLMQLRDPANRMPPYSDKVLSDTEAADIYAYLTSISHGVRVGQIPLLNRGSKAKR